MSTSDGDSRKPAPNIQKNLEKVLLNFARLYAGPLNIELLINYKHVFELMYKHTSDHWDAFNRYDLSEILKLYTKVSKVLKQIFKPDQKSIAAFSSFVN